MVTGPSRAFQHILSAPKTLRKATRSRHLANRATSAFYKIVLRRRSIAPTTSSGKVTFFGGYSAGATTCQFSLPPRRGQPDHIGRRLVYRSRIHLESMAPISLPWLQENQGEHRCQCRCGEAI